MARVNLGRWIKKQAIIPLIVQLADGLDTPLRIEDSQGTLLLAVGPEWDGASGKDAQSSFPRFPVLLGGETVAWVWGKPRVSTIASFLSKLLESESDKRDLVEETLCRYKEVTLLYDVVERIGACLDTREIARLVIEEARRVIPLTGMAVLLCPPGSTDTLDCTGQQCIGQYGPDILESVSTRIPDILQTVWRTGRAQIVNDLHADLRLMEGVGAVTAIMCAPLKAKDRAIGFVLVGHASPLAQATPMAYSSEDFKLFTTLATLAGNAIDNATLYEQLHHAFDSTVYTLAETIEKRDPYTGNHTKRVVEYSMAIGKTMGLSTQDMRRLQMGAALHDIGKIGVRDSILLKNAPLTPEEFAQIKRHPIYGEEILANLPHLQSAMAGVVQHHEKFDGTGYPRGLRGDNIDITARIIAVADTFDAMTSNRPYREGLSLDSAFDELRKVTGTQFDPAVVSAFFASDILEAFFTANSRRKILGSDRTDEVPSHPIRPAAHSSPNPAPIFTPEEPCPKS